MIVAFLGAMLVIALAIALLGAMCGGRLLFVHKRLSNTTVARNTQKGRSTLIMTKPAMSVHGRPSLDQVRANSDAWQEVAYRWFCCCSTDFGRYFTAHNIAGFDHPDHSRMIWTARSSMRKSLSRHLSRDRVLAIGQPEAEMEAVRRKDGIPLQPEVVQWMRDTCEKLSVRCLFWGLPKRCALRNQN